MAGGTALSLSQGKDVASSSEHSILNLPSTYSTTLQTAPIPGMFLPPLLVRCLTGVLQMVVLSLGPGEGSVSL